jgi:hypothetical protein
MKPEETKLLRSLVSRRSEKYVYDILYDYFYLHLKQKAAIVHGEGEHGLDVVIRVDSGKDIIGKDNYILIQAKTGKLTLSKCRKILYQVFELPYHPISHREYKDATLSRRILLVVTGSVTKEADDAISEFNSHHEAKIEVWTLDDLIGMIGDTSVGRDLFDQVCESVEATNGHPSRPFELARAANEHPRRLNLAKVMTKVGNYDTGVIQVHSP